MKFEFFADAVDTPPSRPVNPSVGYPSNGDPATGRPPTTPGAWFFYMLMVEFETLLKNNGIEPSAENLHQLADFFATYKSYVTNSASNALASERNAKASELAAKQLEINAKASEENALQYKNVAVDAKDTTLNAMVSVRSPVSFEAQSLTAEQQSQARENIDVYSKAESNNALNTRMGGLYIIHNPDGSVSISDGETE